ncbi:MAG: hypothetical protein Q9170_005567 [Blastenia crenularia]
MDNVKSLRDALPLTRQQKTASKSSGKQTKHSHKRGQKTLQQRRQQTRRHSVTRQVNSFVPKGASTVLKAQQTRYKIWMTKAKAKAKEAAPEEAQRLKKLVTKKKKQLHYLAYQQRQEYWEKDPEGARTVEQQKNLAAWHQYAREDQGTTRDAGACWVEDCHYSKNWGHHPVPSDLAVGQLHSYFSMKKALGDEMNSEARRLLAYYNSLPLEPRSKALTKARVRMVREMMYLDVLDEEKAKGLEVSESEDQAARLGLTLGEEGWDFRKPPKISPSWKQKFISWMDVEDWTGLSGHEILLRGGSLPNKASKQKVDTAKASRKKPEIIDMNDGSAEDMDDDDHEMDDAEVNEVVKRLSFPNFRRSDSDDEDFDPMKYFDNFDP